MRSLHFAWGMLLIELLFFHAPAMAQMRTIRVCTPGASPSFTYLYIARDRGYFAQEGMHGEVLAARGQLCVTALMTDQINFTVNPNAFDLMVEGKLNAKVLYSASKGLAHRLIVAPGIKSFSDLKGKTIAISTFGGLTDKLSREILSNHGLRAMKDVLLLQIGTGDVRYAALKANKVQAALLVGNYALSALAEGFGELEYEPPPHLSGPLIATDDTLAHDRPMVVAFVRAVTKGHLFYKQKPEEAIAVMRKTLHISDRAQADQIYKDDIRRYNPSGTFDDAYLERVTDRVREDRNVSRKPELRGLFDFSIAKEVEAELKKSGWHP